jgi:hypothetical protein
MKRMGEDQLCGINIPVASGGECFTLMWKDLHIKVDWQLFPPGSWRKLESGSMQEAPCRYASVRTAYELTPALSPDTNVPFIIGRTDGAFGWIVPAHEISGLDVISGRRVRR